MARPVTAALRAGYAWSVRREHPQAWREVARMAGVIMRHCGPGRGPVIPAELVALLHQPLGTWLPTADPALAELVVLDEDDHLTDDTYEVGCDYTVEVLAGQEDPGERWLPSWRVHRAEQVEHTTFQRLIIGTDEDYVVGRRFLVENSAGQLLHILDRQTELGLTPLVEFGAIPQDRQWHGFWWACPVCAWPMSVSPSGIVRCHFKPHRATYTLLNGTGKKPLLQPADGSIPPRAARPVDGAVCVDESIWRYIVVPGVVEVRLRDRINAIAGVSADLYPCKDLYDIGVRRTTEESWRFTLDVKDFASAAALANKLIEKPIAAGHLVIPDYRSDQLIELRRLLPGVAIATETQIQKRIRRTMKEGA
ncbi:restriction endonuclease-related protein [Nonomuraea sp. H19]|uniref:restriction endonuclease-related protein n=1 Tax=Nonomuraea sp. H19 TaxID=3452206 RepID=UPI003F89EB56